MTLRERIFVARAVRRIKALPSGRVRHSEGRYARPMHQPRTTSDRA